MNSCLETSSHQISQTMRNIEYLFRKHAKLHLIAPIEDFRGPRRYLCRHEKLEMREMLLNETPWVEIANKFKVSMDSVLYHSNKLKSEQQCK